MLFRGALGLAIVAGTLGSATADPLVRFGLTSGANRHTQEGVEFGPMVAVGATAGIFTGEASYSYLSMVDPDTGTHRAGVALRADLATWNTHSPRTVYGEAGASHRWGTWRIGDEIHGSERTQNEVHLGVGYQMETKWQLGLRLGLARPDANQPIGMCPAGIACRQITMDSPTDLVSTVMLEWMFMLGR